MASVEEIKNAQRAKGSATVLTIGTATPNHCVHQSNYVNYYIKVTKSEHMTELKKLNRICEKLMIKTLYIHLIEKMLEEHLNISVYMAPSLNIRQEIIIAKVPKLGKEATLRALKKWSLQLSKITYLVFCTTSGVEMPDANYKLANLLGLDPSIRRIMLNHQGSYAGGIVLRVAKDLAKNNVGARVPVVCSEITIVTFRGLLEEALNSLVGQALFGHGFVAVIIGSDPDVSIEGPLFQLVLTA